VITGDTWRSVPTAGSIELQVFEQDLSQANGIAINVPGGYVEGPGHPAAPEVILWPSRDDRHVRLQYTAPKGQVGVCNVYMVGNEGWTRVDRWSENAGMTREASPDAGVVYRCNSGSSNPPTFDDICFTMSVRQ
jgi:hypothetical protein